MNPHGPNIEMVLEEKPVYSDGIKYPIGILRRVTGWTGEARCFVTELCDTEENAEKAMWRLERNKSNVEFDKLKTPVFGEEGRQEIAQTLRVVADELEAGGRPFVLHGKDQKRVGWCFWR